MSDLINIKPIEDSNANNINEICSPYHPIVMMRYQAISSFYAEEPKAINLKKSKKHKSKTFEQVFRLRKWEIDGSINSIMIFSQNRLLHQENNDLSLIFRKVYWNRKYDMEVAQKNIDSRNILLSNWPSLQVSTNYINSKGSISFIDNLFLKIDKMLSKGIELSERTQSENKWNDMEVMRQFEWGQVKSTWSFSKESKVLEDLLESLALSYDSYIVKYSQKVYQFEIDYSIPPEIYKNLITGNR